MSIEGRIKKISKRKIAIFLFILVTVLLSFYLISQRSKPEENKTKKWVIEGGVIGSPINIGKKRIKIVEENKTKNTAFIQNGKIKPEILKINSKESVYIKNLDRKRYVIEFTNYRKSAILYYNQSYHITISSKGSYRYTVSSKNVTLQGTIRVL